MRMVHSCCSKPHWNIAFWQLLVAPGGLVGDTSTRTSCGRKRKQNVSFKDLKSLEGHHLYEQEYLCEEYLPSPPQPYLGVLPSRLSWQQQFCNSAQYVMPFTLLCLLQVIVNSQSTDCLSHFCILKNEPSIYNIVYIQ